MFNISITAKEIILTEMNQSFIKATKGGPNWVPTDIYCKTRASIICQVKKRRKGMYRKGKRAEKLQVSQLQGLQACGVINASQNPDQKIDEILMYTAVDYCIWFSVHV